MQRGKKRFLACGARINDVGRSIQMQLGPRASAGQTAGITAAVPIRVGVAVNQHTVFAGTALIMVTRHMQTPRHSSTLHTVCPPSHELLFWFLLGWTHMRTFA